MIYQLYLFKKYKNIPLEKSNKVIDKNFSIMDFTFINKKMPHSIMLKIE